MTKTSRSFHASSLLLLATLGLGCNAVDLGSSPGGPSFSGDPGGGTSVGSGGGTGVDTGGAQDITYARTLIAQGQVPPADAFTVEGLLSEHDVAAVGPPCHDLLCLRPAVGIAPSLETGKLERWVHVGMLSGLPADFQRPPIDVVVAIDKSASMSIDIQQTTEAVARLAGHLRSDDRIAVLAFDDGTKVIQELGPVTDKVKLQQRIRAVSASGSFDIQRALDESYARFTDRSPDRLHRVIMLSCSYPYISPNGEDETSMKIRAQGAAGIGLTMVGVLLGWDANLAGLIGKANGGNYYYLNDLMKLEQVFDSELDQVLTPLAYDVDLALSVGAGYTLEKMYGLPGDETGAPARGYRVATVFPSKRRGSIVARLASAEEAPASTVATVDFSYRPETALGFTEAQAQSITAVAGAAEADGTSFGSPGVRKAVALVNEITQLKRACESWSTGKHEEARGQLLVLRSYLAAEAAALADLSLAPELALVDRLLQNMAP